MNTKKRLLNKLEQLLYPFGYKYFSMDDEGFMNTTNKEYCSSFLFQISLRSEEHIVSPIAVSIYKVEDIFMKHKLSPEVDFTNLSYQDIYLNTVKYWGEQKLLRYNIESEQDLAIWLKNLEIYFLEYGLLFVEKYNNLPAILDKMNELQQNGQYWGEILGGNTAFLLKGLIISRLCDDPEYSQKVDYVRQLMTAHLNKDWLQTLDRTCEVLEELPNE